MAHFASCSCGQLAVSCEGEPDLVSMCHCLACQRRSGSPYGVAAFFHKMNVKLRGRSEQYRRLSDSGFEILFHFCGRCGASVCWEPARKPEAIAVALGAFGDPDFPAPTQEVFTEHRHGWVAALAPPDDKA